MPRFAVRWLARLLVLVAILAAGAFGACRKLFPTSVRAA